MVLGKSEDSSVYMDVNKIRAARAGKGKKKKKKKKKMKIKI